MQRCIGFLLLMCSHILPAQVLDITLFGAVGNGSALNTTAIQAAIDSCHQAGGGVVRVPPGNFYTGTIFLKSNVTFLIDSGATITGSGNLTDYPNVNPLIRSYTDKYSQKSVFYAEGQSNITITGKGTFNGNGLSTSFLFDGDNRPLGFRFISCSNIRYENITMRHSGFWMMHNLDIDTLVFKNLTIVNHAFGNNDGITIDGCRNVLVDSCKADCNDDPLVMKTSSPIGSENIEIRNCTVSTYSRALKIGTETNGALKNIYLHDCKVQFSLFGPFGTNSPASCGLNLSIVDGGSMENVLVENIEMTGVKTPFFIRLGNRARKYTDTAATPGVGYVRNIELRNITATAVSNIPSSVTGISNHVVENIFLENIDITFPGGWAYNGNTFVAEDENGKPDAGMFGDTLPCSGLFLRHVDSIALKSVCFHPMAADGRFTLLTDDVTHLDSANVCLTNLQNVFSENLFEVFPNPVQSVLVVKRSDNFGGNELVVYNSMGQVVFTSLLSSPQHTFDFSQIPNGIYFVHVGSFSKRIIKY